jgi:ABC-type lipoprotein export system ATPase subunit
LVLSVRDLSKSVVVGAKRQLLFDIAALELGAGEELCVRGPSGSGKSTLLHCLAGLVQPDAGVVELSGQSLFALSEAARDRLRARTIGLVFQEARLLPGLSVVENVLLPLEFAGVPRREARRRAAELCERLGLGDRQRSFPATLSLGEAQRVSLARALVASPSLLLADEPTASLDREAASTALVALREAVSELRAALVIVTHDESIAARFERSLTLDGRRS